MAVRNLLFALLGIAMPVLAAPTFALPLACPVARECFVQNYVDHDPGQTFHDYRCGPLAYDAHRGTDFRVKDLLTLERGVPVLAAAAGRVARVRDGFPDRLVDDLVAREDLPKDGGNLVILEHEDGWTTLYAHLRAGSIAVLPGQRLEKGQHLGLMGLSGRTEFPHVHFEVRHNARLVDPFDPRSEGCAVSPTGMWEDSSTDVLAYHSPGRLGSGFSSKPPLPVAILRNACQPEGSLPDDPGLLVYWTQFVGLAAGDEVQLRLRSPEGKVLSESVSPHKASKAVWLAYAGIRRPSAGWMRGNFVGEWVVVRSGKEVLRGSERVCVSGGSSDCVREVPSCVMR